MRAMLPSCLPSLAQAFCCRISPDIDDDDIQLILSPRLTLAVTRLTTVKCRGVVVG